MRGRHDVPVRAHGHHRVWNDRGSLGCAASLTERVMVGTMALPFGLWQGGGATVNSLTSDQLSDIGNGPTFCVNVVNVAPAGSGCLGTARAAASAPMPASSPRRPDWPVRRRAARARAAA